MSTLRIAITGLGALFFASGCGSDPTVTVGASQFHVEITLVNGKPLPTKFAPLPANHGDVAERWDFTVEVRTPSGEPDPTFNGVVRLSSRPGAISKVIGEGAVGRNLLLVGGKGAGAVELTAVYGPSRLWVDDLGYLPAKPGTKPVCSNGNDDNGDALVDFPADPGCAFAADDTEEGGTYAAGVSNAVEYALPKLSDVQGNGPATPYPYESIEINTSSPQDLVVTRVASDGFYVTDVNAAETANGYNHMFAFNFSTPAKMRVCDRVTYLSGTINEFFGFTELSFPSFKLDPLLEGQTCTRVPKPTLIDASKLKSAVEMEKIESSLVRIEGYHVSANFGPKHAEGNVFAPDASSCDFNDDGQIDFDDPKERDCSNNCSKSEECSEWTAFSARGSYKVSKGPNDMILIQTGTVSDFDPVANKGQLFDAVTGTLRNFSGGPLNWTIEARCSDDLLCGRFGCAEKVKTYTEACVFARTKDDNDEGTN